MISFMLIAYQIGFIMSICVIGRTLGISGFETGFMNGFKEMCSRLQPEKIICYCSHISGMEKYAEILYGEHEARVYSREARKKVINHRNIYLTITMILWIAQNEKAVK
jgi:hypothetical protein